VTVAVLARDALEEMGFLSLGTDLRISDRATFYGCAKIALGSNVRIDDFCVLSAGQGGIAIGNHVHVAVYSALIGAGRITLSDFCNISSRVSIFSSSDDYSGATMTNPTVSDKYKNVLHSDVTLGKHVIVGSGSVILPGTTLEEGVAVGALSLVKSSCTAFGIYAGNPARRVRERKRELLGLEGKFMADKSRFR
jgi:dTDP-4-amino-4,6-dideoxy-D-glucose acyltransferase